MKGARMFAAAAAALLLPLVATSTGQAAPAARPSPVVVIDGTTQLGLCDSVEALTAGPTAAFVCVGDESTDFSALRAAYRTGGMRKVAATSKTQREALVAASGGQQLTGYHNAKDSSTSWTFYATVIYGSIRSDGTITEYGRFFTRDVIKLRGNYADFTFSADRTLGSAMKFRLSNWFSIITGGGSWSDVPKVCSQTVYSGDPYYCNHSYLLANSSTYYTGNGFYGKSQVKWWNQQSPNPSSADGSWTLTESHGPMDCVAGRSQRCQWR